MSRLYVGLPSTNLLPRLIERLLAQQIFPVETTFPSQALLGVVQVNVPGSNVSNCTLKYKYIVPGGFFSVLCGRDQKVRHKQQRLDTRRRVAQKLGPAARVNLSQPQAFGDGGYSWKRWGAGSGNRSRCQDVVICLYSRDFARWYQHGPQSSK